VCDADSDCSAGEYCYKPNKYCYKKKAINDKCTVNEECPGNECRSSGWYGSVIKENRCSCTENADCGVNQYCVKVDAKCGWSYCLDNNKGVGAVPAGWGLGNNEFPQKGLCETTAQCAKGAGTCKEGWGANGCKACTPDFNLSDKEGMPCDTSCNANSLMCTNLFFPKQQQNVCAKVATCNTLKKCGANAAWNTAEQDVTEKKNAVKCFDSGIFCHCTLSADVVHDGCADGYVCAHGLGDVAKYGGIDLCVKDQNK
jgi:hypothetical protein